MATNPAICEASPGALHLATCSDADIRDSDGVDICAFAAATRSERSVATAPSVGLLTREDRKVVFFFTASPIFFTAQAMEPLLMEFRSPLELWRMVRRTGPHPPTEQRVSVA